MVPARLTSETGRDTAGTLVLDTGAGFLGLDHGMATWLGLPDSVRQEPIGYTERPLRRLELGSMQIDQVTPILLLDAGVIRRISGRPVLGLIGQRVLTDRLIWIDYTRQRITSLPPEPAAGDAHGHDDREPKEARDQDRGRARADRESKTQVEVRNDAENDRRTTDAHRSDRDRTAEEEHAALWRRPERDEVERSRRAFAPVMSASARAVPFRLAGDNKMLVRARVVDTHHGEKRMGAAGRKSRKPVPEASNPWLTLVFDTGATKSVLFEPALSQRIPGSVEWPSVRGIVAPTLIGSDRARLAVVPSLELEGIDGRNAIKRSAVDCAVLETELARTIEAATGEPIHGLLGYSFFERYRVGLDFVRDLLWLDPDPAYRSTRVYEYSQVGLQLEGDSTGVRVMSVAEGSPAASAGIREGDAVIAVDGRRVDPGEIVEVTRRLEGPPGSIVRIVIRRDGTDRPLRLVRRSLLH